MPKLTYYRLIGPNRLTCVGHGDTFCKPNPRIRGRASPRTTGSALRRLSWRPKVRRPVGASAGGPQFSPCPWVPGTTRLKVRS